MVYKRDCTRLFSGDMWRALWWGLESVNHFILCPQAFRRDENAKNHFLEIKTRETYCWYDLNRVKNHEKRNEKLSGTDSKTKTTRWSTMHRKIAISWYLLIFEKGHVATKSDSAFEH